MDYEKKYNEALERAKKVKHDVEHIGCSMAPDMLDIIFPELCESEDERIRKWIINEMKIIYDFESPNLNPMVEKALAYLEKQKEIPMPDSTKLIELWHEDKEMLKKKDFRNDPWRLAYNAFLCGFGRGIAVNKQEQPEVDLEKFTQKMNDWKARYNHPDNIPIKATMAFTARMFYQYPNVARQWYDSLPKATMD